MARLNTTSPVKQDSLRENTTRSVRKLKSNTNSLFSSKFRDSSPTPKVGDQAGTLFDEPEFKRTTTRTTTTTSDRPVQRQRHLQRSGTVSSGIFNIFSESDGFSDREDDSFASTARSSNTRSSTEGRPSDPLQLARANSLLMPQSRHSRNRSARKSELYDYTKENYPVEEVVEEYSTTSSISRNPSDASSTRRSPVRRDARQAPTRNKNGRQFRDYRQPAHRSEDEESDDGFNSLDDFIVSDNEEPTHHETSGGESEPEEINKAPSPPRVKRRLVRGRRPNPEAEIKRALESSIHSGLRLEPSLPAAVSMPSSDPQASPRKLFRNTSKIDEKMNRVDLEDDRTPADDSPAEDAGADYAATDEAAESPADEDGSDEDDPSSQLQQDLDRFLGTFEHRPQSSKLEQVNPGTPPASPSKNSLNSPTKGKAQIPPTPYRESVDAFWCQETTNDWIDRHSPRKLQNFLQDFEEADHEVDSDIMPGSRATQQAAKAPSKTALKKAEIEKKKAALARKKSFDNKKTAVAEDFFKVLDDQVTGGQIQAMAQETGGVQILWSKTLQTTAGRAQWKREKQRTSGTMSGTDGASSPRHCATIELAERIIDDEDRLLSTLAHEYCHLANFMISNIHNNPHGSSFKQWGIKCKDALQDHPVYGGRFEVTTKHGYKIDYKYVWSCVDCGQTYGRHSKSIDPTKSGCGKCRGLLQQIKPKPRKVSPRKKPLGDVEKLAVDDVADVLGEISLR
ncbi:SprT-like family-domain-containing protein, partial [Aspergillus coremiiformis]